MRYGLQARIIVLSVCAVAMTACSKVQTCDVSPVELEELKEDISVVDKDLAVVQERIARLTDDLAAKQADLEAKKPQPEQLRKRLELLKRGSGRTEKPKADAKAKKESS